MPRASDATDRLQGTLDMLILKTLAAGPQHGWGISHDLRRTSGDVFQVQQGSLYPALHRLEDRGWIAAEWGTTEQNRRARFYTLTPAGRRQLARETASWVEFVRAVQLVMRIDGQMA
jgi:transcriptional regulator